MSREAVVKSLTTPDLAAVVDLVVWVEDDVAHAANHLGTVRLHDDGTHEVLSGIDPVADEDPMAFLPYDAEVAGAGPRVSTDNAYPYAARRIRSLFGDPDRSPDVAVVHTPRHWFVDEGGHVGEHGSLDVIQSRAPLVLSGPGVRRLGVVDEHARLVDVAPTLAVLSGVPEEDLRDADGAALDGRALTAYLEAPEARRRPRVVGILWDGAHCGDLLHLAETGHLPGVARLLERGLALRGGAVAEFPSVTLTNHTSILTGVGPGRHGVLGNVYYDRALQERVVPNDAETWHRSAEWLRPGAREEPRGQPPRQPHDAPTASGSGAPPGRAIGRRSFPSPPGQPDENDPALAGRAAELRSPVGSTVGTRLSGFCRRRARCPARRLPRTLQSDRRSRSACVRDLWPAAAVPRRR